MSRSAFFLLFDLMSTFFYPIIMKKEDDIFKSMNINFAPDNSVDQVLEQLWEKISQKSSM